MCGSYFETLPTFETTFKLRCAVGYSILARVYTYSLFRIHRSMSFWRIQSAVLLLIKLNFATRKSWGGEYHNLKSAFHD